MSRRRYQARTEAPNCVHRAGPWYEYQTVLALRQEQPYSSGHRWPETPKDSGHCEDCLKALWSSREHWPAEVWAYLDAQAAESYQPGSKFILKAPRSLPKYHGARRETPDKLFQRACGVYALKPGDPELAKIERFKGTDVGQGYVLAQTDGKAAVCVKGEGAKGIAMLTPAIHGIDLPGEFHAALQRVRLMASDRTAAIKLSVGDWGVVLSASSEDGEASERIDLPGERPAVEAILDADYLDAICGSWPLRWDLRPGKQAGEVPQTFQPHGADWRAVIMPMRV